MRRFCLLCVGMRRSCLLCVGSCFGWVGGAVLVGAKRGFRATNDVDISVGLALLSQTLTNAVVFFASGTPRQSKRQPIVLARGVVVFCSGSGCRCSETVLYSVCLWMEHAYRRRLC